MRRKAKKKITRFLFGLSILGKFFQDRKLIKLKLTDFRLYSTIHKVSNDECNRFPDLINPKSFNDKIQWLKLFDKNKLSISCTDKLGVREHVNKELGRGYVPELYEVAESFETLNFKKLPESFVLKTNHDSGSVFVVRKKSDATIWAQKKRFEKSLSKTYGERGGEWQYQYITPKIFAEEFIGDAESKKLPADYKFHCCNGEVKWLQYIYDRENDVKETIVLPDGSTTDIHFDHNMKSVNGFKKPDEWNEMINVASALSKPFKYVRVDLYLNNENIYVGEMTFFPLMGCYLGKGQETLGELLDFSLSRDD